MDQSSKSVKKINSYHLLNKSFTKIIMTIKQEREEILETFKNGNHKRAVELFLESNFVITELLSDNPSAQEAQNVVRIAYHVINLLQK